MTNQRTQPITVFGEEQKRSAPISITANIFS